LSKIEEKRYTRPKKRKLFRWRVIAIYTCIFNPYMPMAALASLSLFQFFNATFKHARCKLMLFRLYLCKGLLVRSAGYV
jgi:hypothetical protein